ncbi:uncharacterized protein LOC111290155 [Durio zibethinus]|uniref:Uncharacterized protein LOC111290155 n=1 Tax=Durio zibethinus TaxID=66656 RepID=A0A6P5YB29_DURZI|nr:uncharacterized protein LOC111290155 [Durio zibethinus]
MRRRYINAGMLCSQCYMHEETLLHALRDCERAIAVWLSSGCDSKCKNGEMRNADDMARFATDFLEEYMRAQCRTENQGESTAHWKPPPSHAIKVNFDGALNIETATGGIGVGVRNHKGEVLRAVAKRVEDIRNALLVEPIAAVARISLAQELGFRSIILEGDASKVISKLNQGNKDLPANGNILEDAKILKQSFNYIREEYVRRHANDVAHILARLGWDCQGTCTGYMNTHRLFIRLL